MKQLFSKIKNPKVLRVLVAALVVALCTAGSLYLQMVSGRVFINDSLVSVATSQIAPLTPGTLQQMDVYEGESVKKGQILAVVNGAPLYAEENGLIIQTNNQIGSIVSSQNSVVSMIDPSQMRIAGTIDENKGLNEITVGQVVSFTVDALPGKTFWGYVDEVSPSAKQTALSFSISSERPTQQFVIYARFNALKYPEIKNGMSAKMTVFTQTH